MKKTLLSLFHFFAHFFSICYYIPHHPSPSCLLLLLLRAALRFWRGLREATSIGLALLLLLLLLLLARAEMVLVLVLAEAFLGRLLFRGEEERKRGLRFSNNNDNNNTVVVIIRFCNKNEELFLLLLLLRRRRSRNGSETEFSRTRIYQSLNSPCLSSARQPLARF